MGFLQQKNSADDSIVARIATLVLRLILVVAIPLIAFAVLYAGFIFLRDGNVSKWVITAVAIIWGGGVAALFWDLQLDRRIVLRYLAGAFAAVCLCRAGAGHPRLVSCVIPVGRTFYISLFDRDGPGTGQFIGLANYATVFTDRLMREAFRNNIFLWIISPCR